MPIEPPSWATPEEISDYGTFLSLFKNRRHFEHSRRTGSVALPSSDRRKAQLQADPLKRQRVRLRHRLSNARRAIADAERKLAEAREDLARGVGPWNWDAQGIVTKQTDRLAQLTTAHQRAALDLELFDAFNPRTTQSWLNAGATVAPACST